MIETEISITVNRKPDINLIEQKIDYPFLIITL